MENNTNNQNQPLTLGDLVKMIWKNILWLVGFVVGFTLIAGIYAFAIASPTYKSNASIIVNSSKFNDATSSENYANALRATSTISKWLKDTTVVEDTIEKLGIDMETKTFQDNISTTSTTTDLIIYVSYEGATPAEAQLYLNMLIDRSIHLAENYEQLKDSYELLGTASLGEYASPNKLLFVIIGFAAGAVLGLVFIFLKEAFRNKFHEIKEVEDKLNLKVIGNFLDDENLKDKSRNLPFSKLNENNYERLLANIDFSNVDNKIKTIAFTSSLASEGKSSVVFQLANTIAKNHKKVLVIDLDLRKAKVHKYFGIEKGKGITDYVTQQAKLEEVIIKKNEYIDIISAGYPAPNPAIILQSDPLKELIDSLKDKYDYVLIDTPPVFVAGDAKTICNMVDSTIVVVAAYQTPISISKDMINDLLGTSDNVLGAVVTKLKVNNTRSYNSYYSSYSKYLADNIEITE